MELLSSIVGYIVITSAAILTALFALCIAIERFEEFRKNMVSVNVDKARRDLGLYIQKESYWFSESEDAQELMKALGKAISEHQNGIYNVETVRTEWRGRTRRTI